MFYVDVIQKNVFGCGRATRVTRESTVQILNENFLEITIQSGKDNELFLKNTNEIPGEHDIFIRLKKHVIFTLREFLLSCIFVSPTAR